MGNYELDDNDVLSLATKTPLLGETTTFKVAQMKSALKQQLTSLPNVNPAAMWWLDKGYDCELLSVTQGRGWRKGKIRLRLEIVLDEPEPEPEPVNDDPNSLDSLRSELYPKQ